MTWYLSYICWLSPTILGSGGKVLVFRKNGGISIRYSNS